MTRHLSLAAALMLATAACTPSDKSMLSADSGAFEDVAGSELHLNIHPSDATPDLLPQTYLLPRFTDWLDTQVQVRPTVQVRGTVRAFVPTPYLVDPTVPGEQDAPIAANVSIYQQDGLGQGSAATDADGAFTISIPAGQLYRMLVVPQDTDQSPFLLADLPAVFDSTDLGTIQVEHGVPVWGSVRYSDGSVPTDIRVTLQDAQDGSKGASVSPDEQGWFMLRALPGSYDLVVGPASETMNPTQFTMIEVEADNTDGVQVELNLGPPERYRISGTLVDAEGERLGASNDYLIRMSSVRLDEAAGSFVSETRVDQHGAFNLDVMNGSYTLEVIPAYEAGRSPVILTVDVSDRDQSLDDIVVPGRTLWSGQVLDESGAPVPSALVVAQETGFDRYTYTATAGSDGVVVLELPETELDLTLTPPDDKAATTFLTLRPGEDAPELILDSGFPIAGVLELDGEPVPFALIDITTADGEKVATTLSNGDGAFSLRIQSDLLEEP